jgi:polyhydroxybutyrate depolymerase
VSQTIRPKNHPARGIFSSGRVLLPLDLENLACARPLRRKTGALCPFLRDNTAEHTTRWFNHERTTMTGYRNSARTLCFLLCCVILLSACALRRKQNPDTLLATAIPTAGRESDQPLDFSPGRNDYGIEVDGIQREFIVHVPGGYRDDHPTPVVFIFHGSNQHPGTMYNNTTWVEKAEQETIIIVYPGSWKYRLAGEPGLQEKWNSRYLFLLVEPGTELKDDVKFVREVLARVTATFNVDESRIYASGFSNGADFVLTRMVPEMNDVFAAFSTAGVGPSPQRGESDDSMILSTSLYSIFGSNDKKIAEILGLSTPFPFKADDIVKDPNFASTLESATTMLGLEMACSVESGPTFTRLIYDQNLAGADNEYIFMMIIGMGHVYPNGENNGPGINAADLFWEFFMRHPRP